MKLLILALSGIIACGIVAEANARPVSYPEGWTIMQMNDEDANGLHIHYSPTAKYSIGYKAEYWRDMKWQFHGVQLNHLVKRWNQPDSQANLYLKNGVGLAYSDFEAFDQESSLAGFTGVAVDWENRRFFTSYENRLYYAGDLDQFFMQKARIGVAPYIGEYGDIHTWLMLQVDHNPKKHDEVTFTPMLRFFKSEYLAELGLSNQGHAMFNWIIRF